VVVSHAPTRDLALQILWRGALVALLASWIVLPMGRAQEPDAQQGRALSEIQKLGGQVERDEKAPGTPVVGVILRGARISDNDLAGLGGMTGLRTLDLTSTSISDAGLSHLKKLPHLQSLDLTGTPVTDAGKEKKGDITKY